MGNDKYLYGASVQGIQDFIFRTNELKDIVGASELVEKICTDAFLEFGQDNSKTIVKAAGNVKYIFDNAEDCRRAVRYYPKKVMEMAPGITISQAVVKVSADLSDFTQKVEELEKNLHIQRNKPLKSLVTGTRAMLRSRRTGLPAMEAVRKDGDTEYLDEATIAKRKSANPANDDYSTLKLARKSFGNEELSARSLALNIGDMTDQNDWIAIIHADGNGLGQVVAEKNKKPEELRLFSESLDHATVTAARQTHRDIITSDEYVIGKVVPFRPVVLGGDDMTIICRANLAMTYATLFIRHFEENTQKAGNGLTACAGIAYMKSSYPFHYGYDLAEALCEEAKKDAKKPEHLRDGLAPSCIMFHKIQGSYIGSFRQIEENELTLGESDATLKFGPYYLRPMEGRWTVENLREHVAGLNSEKGNAAKTDIRRWLSLMWENRSAATQLEKRSMTILSGNNKKSFKDATTPSRREDGVTAYPAYDILQLLTVENQITKKEEDDE